MTQLNSVDPHTTITSILKKVFSLALASGSCDWVFHRLRDETMESIAAKEAAKLLEVPVGQHGTKLTLDRNRKAYLQFSKRNEDSTELYIYVSHNAYFDPESYRRNSEWYSAANDYIELHAKLGKVILEKEQLIRNQDFESAAKKREEQTKLEQQLR